MAKDFLSEFFDDEDKGRDTMKDFFSKDAFADFDRQFEQTQRLVMVGWCFAFVFYGVLMALMIAGIYWLVNNV